jgi:hypothetical protein
MLVSLTKEIASLLGLGIYFITEFKARGHRDGRIKLLRNRG